MEQPLAIYETYSILNFFQPSRPQTLSAFESILTLYSISTRVFNFLIFILYSFMCHFLINSITTRLGILNLKSGLIKLSVLNLDLQWMSVSIQENTLCFLHK